LIAFGVLVGLTLTQPYQNKIKLKIVMKKNTIKSGILVLLVAVVGAMPIQLRAGDSTPPAAEKKEAKPRKAPAVTPFNGKLKAVDQMAKTISVGNRTIHITSETKIMRDDKPAVLSDSVVGDKVAGAFKTGEDGKLNATMIRFGNDTAKPKKPVSKKETKETKEM
jgi:hypothetical protein